MVDIRRLLCGLAFGLLPLVHAAPAEAQTTALFVDSPSNTTGGRRFDTLTPADGTFTVTRDSISKIRISVSGRSRFWSLTLSAGAGRALGVGEYLDATWEPLTIFTGLSISGEGVSCSALSGRFIVREAEYAPNGEVIRFAADAEQHCGDQAAATFAAIRYNSTISDLLPFGGNYPRFELAITSPANGAVTGGTVACGGGQTACSETFAQATVVTLTATPDAGYVFSGWTGACTGGAAQTSVHVNSIRRCGATFQATPPSSPRSLFFAHSEPGESIGAGKTHVFSPANSVWTVEWDAWDGDVLVNIDAPGTTRQQEWEIRLSAPAGRALAPGTYSPVNWSASDLEARLYVRSQNSFCSAPTGRFIVHDIEFGFGGEVIEFSADVEVHCGTAAPGLFIAIRYNSTRPDAVPFGGVYPEYKVTVEPPVNGIVTGASQTCGGGSTSCEWSSPSVAPITLTATPDPGYVFAGWGGSCAGGPAVTITLNAVKSCSATFLPSVPVAPRSLLFVDSMPGDSVGQGRQYMYSPENSLWTVTLLDGGRGVRVNVEGYLDTSWSLEFEAPRWEILGVGSYTRATSSARVFAGLDVRGNGPACSAVGRFIVRDILITNGQVIRFAADLEQHCSDDNPGLFAAVRYNSLYAETRPFAGAYPRYELAIAPRSHGTVTGTGIDCGNGQTACAASFGTPQVMMLTATPAAGYIFTGWVGDCSGGPTATLRVNTVRNCAAGFEPVTPTAPRTLLVWSAQPGYSSGAEGTRILSPENSIWTVTSSEGGRTVDVEIDAVMGNFESQQRFRFRAAPGAVLQPGTYVVGPRTFPQTGPEMEIRSAGCSGTGRFVVRQLSRDPQTGIVSAFAVDFEHRCPWNTTAALVGSLQYQATIDVVTNPSPHDFNADGKLDLYWQHETEGWIAAWRMDRLRLADARLTTPSRVADTNWKIVGSGDFNADGKPDLFWQHRLTRLMTVWYMNGADFIGTGLLSNNTVSDTDWEIRAIADFNQDGRPDLIWQHRTRGSVAVWIMDGVRLVEGRPLTPGQVSDVNWKIAGSGDFNRDGHTDLFWRNEQTGAMTVWYMNGSAFLSAGAVTPGVVSDIDWEIRAIADVDDDGDPDLLWQNRTTGRLSVWLMNGVNLERGAAMDPGQVDRNWRLAGPR